MKRRTVLFIGVNLALLAFTQARPAFAVTGCNKTTEVTSCSGSGCTNGTNISSGPSRICSVQLFATGANAWAQIFDSPDDTAGHGQSVIRSEPGVATAGNSVTHFFGDEGLPTTFSLGAIVVNGRLVVHYDD